MGGSTAIRWEQGDDGVVVLILDDPIQAASTMNAAFVASLGAIVERLEAQRDSIAGVIVTSAAPTLFAGGDLRSVLGAGREHGRQLAAVKDRLRRLETLGRPVVAAINGSALGGGLEIALACHHRIAVADPRIQLGLPEVTLGLLPGGGGVVRTVRLLGLVDALVKVLLEGKPYGPDDAKKIGLLDELVDNADALIPAARAWIQANPSAVQPWDRPDHALSGGVPSGPQLVDRQPALPMALRKQVEDANYPAPRHIVAAAVEGAGVDIATACEIEGRHYLELITGQVANNMIQAFVFDMQRVSGRHARRSSIKERAPTKTVVLGAGMMGAAIAYLCARVGLDVVLKDVSKEAADHGKRYAELRLGRELERGRATAEQVEALLARIHPTVDYAAVHDADLVIEAIFEEPALKMQVFAEIEPHLASGALLASNTSTLPITSLAKGVSNPANFIGLHFFSPVDRMPLLEIIRGEKTSDRTLRRALDIAKLLEKTPILVNDSRGFFTSRVMSTFIHEGIAMLLEGVPAWSIEQAASAAGYSAPVLQVSDELNLRLLRRIRDASKAAAQKAGEPWHGHPADLVIDRMLDEFERSGRLGGAGFYNYEDGTRTGLWPGLRALGVVNHTPPFEDIRERLLFIEPLETVRCLDEGVIESVADANIGSILGIGFPRWTGGVLQYINGYDGQLQGFVARARELAAAYGERFEPPASLVAKARSGQTYRDVY